MTLEKTISVRDDVVVHDASSQIVAALSAFVFVDVGVGVDVSSGNHK